MIVAPGSVQISVDVQFLDDSGFPVTGKVAADFPACKWSNGDNTADTTITLSDLALITTAHPNNNTAGGVKEREGGWYRLDLPNNMVSALGRKTLTFAETTGKRIIAPFIDCQYPQANTVQISGTIQTGADVGETAADVDELIATIGVNGAGLSAVPDTAGTTTLLTRLTAARAGYLDNLNVGGNVASHADILAINQSASKHVLLVTVAQYEPGETYTVEARTFAAADGSAVNADSTPSLTATGQVSGNLSANLSAATNPATGVYRWTYTPGASPTLEQIRFDLSATISSATFTLSTYAQTVDEASVVWTATDQSHLTSVFNKLPVNNIADETLVLAAVGSPMQAGTQVTVATNNDKTGYALSAAGLDQISVADPGGVAGQTTFPKILVALYRRFFKKSTLTASQLLTYADNGTSVNTTQAVSDDGTTQTQGTAT